LQDGVSFYFETFGFPVEILCNEYVPPTLTFQDELRGMDGRVRVMLGWTFTMDGLLKISMVDECAS